MIAFAFSLLTAWASFLPPVVYLAALALLWALGGGAP